MGQLNVKNNAFFNLISNALFNTEICINNSVDFMQLYKEARFQAVDSLIFDSVSPYLNKSDDVYKLWYKNTLHTISNNYKVEESHGVIGKLLSNNGIEYSILKGCRSACFYVYNRNRSLGDVDFLVKLSDVEKTCKVLEENGFVKYNNADEHEFHIIYLKDKVCYELHYRFDDGVGKESEDFTGEIISTAIDFPVLEGKATVKACDDLHHALVMLYHMKRHMNTAGMGLRHLCDWAVFVNSFENEEFIEKFKTAIDNKGLWKFAKALSLVANKFIGLPYKEWFGEFEENVLDWIMEYIYSNGNFGSKEVSLAPLLSQNTDIGTSNLLAQFTASIKKIVYSHWQKARTNKLLLLGGFVYFPLKYFIKSIFGKRKKIEVLKTIKTGTEINYVFKELGFYEK